VAELRGAGEALAVQPTDIDVRWVITLGADGFAWAHGIGEGDATVAGTAADLYMLLWGRRRSADPRYEVAGDGELLTRWLTNSAL
jgi:hypothetical protein